MTDRVPKRILVSGASRGLGQALAVHLATRHDVVAGARDPEDLGDLTGCNPVQLDVTDPISVKAATERAGHVDVLVNNAAITVRSPVEALTDDDATRLWQTNVLGPLRLARAVLPGMRQRGHGTIVNVSSFAAVAAPPLQGMYAATKAGLDRLTEALRFEVAPFGIAVVTATVGPVATTLNIDPPTEVHDSYVGLIDQVTASQKAFADSGRPMDPAVVAARLSQAVVGPHPPAVVTVAPLAIRVLGTTAPRLLALLMARGVDW